MQREEKKLCIVEHLLCSCDSATTVLNETLACLYFVLPKGNLNGYISPGYRGDGRCGAGTGSRLPQPAGRYTCQGNWKVYKVNRSGLYQARDTPIHRLSAVRTSSPEQVLRVSITNLKQRDSFPHTSHGVDRFVANDFR